MPDLNLLQARENIRQELTAAETTVANLQAALDQADAALAATMVPGKEYATSIDHPPTIVAIDGRIQFVRAPFLGDPEPATA